jgi:YggT family protein
MMILALLIDGYTFIVFVAVILSWFRLSPDNPVVRVTSALTEPVLEPIRKILPGAGGFDFSPMVLLLGLQLLRRLLFR